MLSSAPTLLQLRPRPRPCCSSSATVRSADSLPLLIPFPLHSIRFVVGAVAVAVAFVGLLHNLSIPVLFVWSSGGFAALSLFSLKKFSLPDSCGRCRSLCLLSLCLFVSLWSLALLA